MHAFRLRTLFPSFLLLAAAAYAADEVKPEAIIDKFVEVTGGKAAYDNVKTELATGELEISQFGINGSITSYKAAPNKSYTLIDLGGAGQAEEGSNGEVAWSINGMQGPRIKEGDERIASLRNDAFHAETRWRDFFKKAELAGSEDVNGKACYKIVLTPNEGSPETRYYEKSTNLLTKLVVPVTTPDGTATAELTLGDYRKEGDILMPHTINQKLPTVEILVKIKSVQQNADIPAGKFDLPADIKALLPKDKK